MSTSTSDLPATLKLRAGTSWAELTVSDSRHRTVARGVGDLETAVPPGVYLLEYRAGSAMESRLVAVEPGQTYEPDPVHLLLPGAAPVEGTDTFDAEHARAAREHSQRLPKDADAGIVLMVRGTAGAESSVGQEDIGDVRVLGRPLEWELGTGYAIWSSPVQAGGHSLRAPRDKLPADLEPVLEQPLFTCSGWQTLVFVPCGLRGPVFAELSVHMAPMQDGWDPAAGSALAVEALLARLRSRGDPPPAAAVTQTEAEIARNPMAAILLAYLMLDGPGDPDPAISRLIARLRDLLPDHPDVRALAWLDPARGPSRPAQVDWPPLVAAGYEAVERLDAEHPGVQRDGSAAVRLAANRLKEGVWTAWHPEGVPSSLFSVPQEGQAAPTVADPATQRVLAHLEREELDDEATDAVPTREQTSEIAYYTGLSTAAVARALTDIEAAGAPSEPPGGTRPPAAPVAVGPSSPVVSRDEQRLGMALRVLALVMGLWAVAIGAALDNEGTSALAVISGVMRCALIAGICAVASSDVRRFGPLTQLVVGAFAIESILVLLLLATGADGDVELLGTTTSAVTFLLCMLAADLTLTVVLAWLWNRTYKGRWGLKVLSPGRHRTLAALSEAIQGTEARVPPEAVAANVESYLARAPARLRAHAGVALTTVGFWPLLRGRATFSLLSVRDRLGLAQRVFATSHETAAAPLQGALRIAHQLAALGYYSDPRAAAAVGVVDEVGATAPPPARARPTIRTLARDRAVYDEVDAVVVGSGAAGAVMAYRLAERGLRTLIVERGRQVDPTGPGSAGLQTMPDLFADAGAGLLSDFDRRVIQANCIGGNTSIGAATWQSVSPLVIERWADADLDAGLDGERFRAAWERVQQWVPGNERPEGRVSEGARRMLAGMRALGYDAPTLPPADDWGTADAAAPLSARSQAVLDTLLPWGQRRFGDDLQVLAGCEAQRIETEGKAPSGVRCRIDGREVTIATRIVALAAGAVGTTQLLKRSDIGRGVGRRFSFDLSSTLTADFPQIIDAHEGIQLLTDIDPEERTFVVETVWPPLWLQSMAMPGLFEQHAENMMRYRNMAAARVHLGIDNRTLPRLGTHRRPTDIKLGTEELHALADRLAIVGNMWLAAGAERVMPATVHYRSYEREADLAELKAQLKNSDDISVIVRPQGGTPISRDPRRGVVDPQLRVHGYSNLYVCDGSAFPTSVARAPRLTAMALAEYAAEGIQ